MSFDELKNLSQQEQKAGLKAAFDTVIANYQVLKNPMRSKPVSLGHQTWDKFRDATLFAEKHKISLVDVIDPKLHREITSHFLLR